jgi:hypothetical protein
MQTIRGIAEHAIRAKRGRELQPIPGIGEAGDPSEARAPEQIILI